MPADPRTAPASRVPRGWQKCRKGSKAVPCPACGGELSRVYDKDGVDRFRECAACEARYVTKEVLDRRIA